MAGSLRLIDTCDTLVHRAVEPRGNRPRGAARKVELERRGQKNSQGATK